MVVLEAGISVLRMCASMPQFFSGQGPGGQVQVRPMASAILQTGTPSSPTALSTAPAGA